MFVGMMNRNGGGAAVVVPPTWDATAHGLGVTIDPANTASFPNFGWRTVRSTTSQSTGLRYAEFQMAPDPGSNAIYGVCNASVALDSYQDGSAGVARQSSGTIFGGGGGSESGYSTEIVGVLVDFTAHTVKFNTAGGAFGTAYDFTGLADKTLYLSGSAISGTWVLPATLTYPLPPGATPWNAA